MPSCGAGAKACGSVSTGRPRPGTGAGAQRSDVGSWKCADRGLSQGWSGSPALVFEHTLFVLDWHPLRGPGTRMHGLPVDYVVAIRNGMMLTKLARIAVREHRRDGQALAGE